MAQEGSGDDSKSINTNRDQPVVLTREKAEQIVGAIPVPAVISHLESHEIHTVNKHACALFGYSPEQFRAMRVDDITHPEFQPELPANYLQCLSNNGLSTIKRYRKADGTEFSAQLTAATIDGESGMVCAVIIETDSVLALESDLVEASKIDPLTRVLRREAFLTSATRAAGLWPNFGMLFIDLNDFKKINDIHGHDAGDSLLVHSGQLLRGFFRQNDLIGRYGGDEFIVLVPNLPSAAVLDKICVKLAEKLTEPLVYQSNTLSVSASIGGVFADKSKSVSTVVKAADKAMYSAKNRAVNYLQVPPVHIIDLSKKNS